MILLAPRFALTRPVMRANSTGNRNSNPAQSTSVLKVTAAQYGALKFADVVVGVELVKAPISSGKQTS